MCAGLALFRDMNEIRVFFPNPRARLLCMKLEGGPQVEAIWGRRNQQEYPESGLPVTGWARKESLDAGKWDRFQGEHVYVPALSYMEKDAGRQSHWFDLERDQFLVGMLVGWRDLKFVYMVTVPTPEMYRHIHHRWVLIQQLLNVQKPLPPGGGSERALF